MSAAVPGTPVTSANPNTTTNTSLAVTLGSTTVGDLNVITLAGLASGTGINPTVTTPTGWTKVFEQMSNSGTPSTFVATYWRFYQSGDGTAQTFSWANTGQMVASCEPFSNADTTTPVPYSNSIPHASGAGATYAITGTTGTDPGLLVYGGANKTGTAWSNLTDNDAGQRGLSSSATMCQRITTAELAGGTAYSKTMTGSASTIGVQWAFIVKGSSSTAFTGSATLSGSGSLTTTQTPSAAGIASLSGSGSLAVSGAVAQPGAAAMSGAGSLTSTGAPATGGTATLAGSGTLTGSGQTAIVRQLLTGGTQWPAHRDATYATNGEETLEGYRAAYAQYSKAILEISVWDTSDGVYVCSHDQTTSRVFSGTNFTITSTTWATLSPNGTSTVGRPTTIIGGNPMRRLEEILDAFPAALFIVENKHGTNQATLSTLLDSHAAGRWMFKGPYNDTANAVTAAGHGAPMWLYFYPSQLGSLSTSYSAVSGTGVPIVFGLGDYSTAPVPVQSDATTFFTFTTANGIKTWAHILGTTAQRTTADGQATTAGGSFNGYMTSAYPTLAPSDGDLATLSGSGSLSASTAPAIPGAAALTGSGALAAATTPALPGAASLNGAGSLAANAGPAIPGTANLSGTGSLAAAGSPNPAAPASLNGSGTLVASTSLAVSRAAALAGVGSLAAGASPALATVAGLTGAGVLLASTAPTLATAAALAGVGSLTAAAGGSAATTVALTGLGTLATAASPSTATLATLTGTGSLTVTATENLTGGAALSGVGSLTAPAHPGIGGGAALNGLGNLTTSAGLPHVTGGAVLAGLGTLTTTTQLAVPVGALLSGTGALLAAAEIGSPVRDLTYSVFTGRDRWHVTTGSSRWTVTTGAVE